MVVINPGRRRTWRRAAARAGCGWRALSIHYRKFLHWTALRLLFAWPDRSVSWSV